MTAMVPRTSERLMESNGISQLLLHRSSIPTIEAERNLNIIF